MNELDLAERVASLLKASKDSPNPQFLDKFGFPSLH
jgi:hypothetical protein